MTGAQQVDPLGPVLFAIALQQIIDKLRQKMAAAVQRYNGALRKPCFLAFYIDDDVLLADHCILADVAHYLTTAEPRSFGLHLKLSGTKAWCPHSRVYQSHKPQQRRKKIATRLITTTIGSIIITVIIIVVTSGHSIRATLASIVELELFNSAPQSVRATLCGARYYIVDEIAKTLHLLTELDDAHTSFTLLRACFAGTKMNFRLRCVPTHLTEGAAAK